MKWVNTELPKKNSRTFKEYLRDMHIRFEASECGDLIHFECYMSQDEISKANAFIDSLDI